MIPKCFDEEAASTVWTKAHMYTACTKMELKEMAVCEKSLGWNGFRKRAQQIVGFVPQSTWMNFLHNYYAIVRDDTADGSAIIRNLVVHVGIVIV